MQFNRDKNIEITASDLGKRVFVDMEASIAWVELIWKFASRTPTPFYTGKFSEKDISDRAKRLDLFQEIWNTLPESIKSECRKRIMS